MSMILTLTSAAIIAGVTISQSAIMTAVVCAANRDTAKMEEGLETCFVDQALLLKTLNAWDCHCTVNGENEILVETNCGNLRYARGNSNEAFRLYLGDVRDVDGLLENLRSFEEDYGRNVQSYTYDHLKKNLPANMVIDAEDMEDDTLVITIRVD